LDLIGEKKIYEERIKAVETRINKLKKQEKEISTKTKKLKDKIQTEQKLKAEKQERKTYLENQNFQKMRENELRKEEIERLRQERRLRIEKKILESNYKNKVGFLIKEREITNKLRMRRYFGNLYKMI
jgi:hypothetical protein